VIPTKNRTRAERAGCRTPEHHAYEVVARRWRPLTFDSVVGQKHVTATLAAALERDRWLMPSSLPASAGWGDNGCPLAGPRPQLHRAQGRGALQRVLSCTQILTGSSVDVLEIDGASNRGIDEVRALIEGAAYRPAGGRYRIYIIDEVHQLTRRRSMRCSRSSKSRRRT